MNKIRSIKMGIRKKILTAEELLINKTFLIANAIIKITISNQKETASFEEIYEYLLEIDKLKITKEEIASLLEMAEQRCSWFFIRKVKFINPQYDENTIKFDGEVTTGYGLSLLYKQVNCIESES